MLALIAAAAVAAYGTAASRLRRRGDRWPLRRAGCLLVGSACAAAAVLPPVASHDGFFPVHIAQHLLLGMAGPALLALSAPVTLALRTLPRRLRRVLLRVLHSAPAALVSAPATALVLDLGVLYALYLTGLYHAAEHDSLVHAAVHLHMFLAGCLLSWALIGIDPVRGAARHRGEAGRPRSRGRQPRHARQAHVRLGPPGRRRSRRRPSPRRGTDVLRRHRRRRGPGRDRDGPVVHRHRPFPRPGQAQAGSPQPPSGP